VEYLAIDPGKTTGWVTGYTVDTQPLKVTRCDDLELTPENIRTEFDQWYYQKSMPGKRQVLCESFISLPTEFYADANWSCQLIGCVRLLCAEYAVPVLHRVPKARTQITPQTLRDSGYWVKGGKDDKREAMKHLLAYLVEIKHRPTMYRLYPR